MPFLVITKRAGLVHDTELQERPFEATLSRLAVATLEEVHRLVGRMVRQRSEGSYEDWCAAYPLTLKAADIPESGGSVGPLPDGTLIEVEATTYDRLGHDLDLSPRRIFNDPEQKLVDAWNAKEAQR